MRRTFIMLWHEESYGKALLQVIISIAPSKISFAQFTPPYASPWFLKWGVTPAVHSSLRSYLVWWGLGKGTPPYIPLLPVTITYNISSIPLQLEGCWHQSSPLMFCKYSTVPGIPSFWAELSIWESRKLEKNPEAIRSFLSEALSPSTVKNQVFSKHDNLPSL